LRRDLSCADEGRPRRAFVYTSQRIGHHQLTELFDETVVAPQVVVALRRWRFEAHRDYVARRQQIPKLGRQVAHDDTVAFGILHHLYAKEVVECGHHKLLHRLRIADSLIDLAEVGLDFLRLDGVLSKDAG